jgi:tetratricopeptide (TPR) repeat protein
MMNSNENRFFKRHKNLSKCKLILKGKYFEANIVDYSINGFGLILREKPVLPRSKIVNLQLHKPFHDTVGIVTWKKQIGDYLRVGVKTALRIRGSLKDYWLSDILIGLQRSRKTGPLKIKKGPVEKIVYIENGDIIFASSNQENDRLDRMLLKEGRLSKQKYNVASDLLKKTGKRQEEILVETGCLKPDEMIRAVNHQVESIICSLFRFTDGAFDFKEGPLPSNEAITLHLSTANIIYKGIKSITDIEHIKKMFPHTDAIVFLSSYPIDLFQDLDLHEDDRTLLSYIDGKSSLEDIFYNSHLDELEIVRTIFALLCTRIIDIKEEEQIYPHISPDDVLDKHEIQSSREIIEKIENISNSYKNLNYYEILNLPNFTSTKEIKRAYYTQAKEFHPDRHFRLPPDIKDKLELIFSYINEAYITLVDPKSKEKYDGTLLLKESSNVSDEEFVCTQFEEGRLAFWNGNFRKAEKIFRQIVSAKNQTGKYLYYYAMTLSKLKKYKEAEKAIMQAIKEDSSNPDYLLEAGCIYCSVGLIHKAKHCFMKVLQLQPSNKKAKESILSLKTEHKKPIIKIIWQAKKNIKAYRRSSHESYVAYR